MIRSLLSAGFPARLLSLARDAFEVSAALRFDAPWDRAG